MSQASPHMPGASEGLVTQEVLGKSGRWMDGQVRGPMHRKMGEWTESWLDRQLDSKQRDEWLDGQTEKWLDEQMDKLGWRTADLGKWTDR